MEFLIDSSLWIDLFRRQTPVAVRRQALEQIAQTDAVVAEPVLFEVRRNMARTDRARLESQLETVPMLKSPADLWRAAIFLGQKCADAGISVGAMDTLIAAVAIHHGATVLTFDADFERLAQVSELRVNRLVRAD